MPVRTGAWRDGSRSRVGGRFSSGSVWIACAGLVILGAAVQVAVGAGLSVVSGAFVMLWLGPVVGVPVLLCLNLVVSVVATCFGGWRLRWGDVALASAATLAGCLAASAAPVLPDRVLKAMTAGVLVAIALPRPRVAGLAPSRIVGDSGVALAGLVTGALTVWTATPGPITPVTLAWAGRSGVEIRRAMQPIGVLAYAAALAWAGGPPVRVVGAGVLGGLVAATLAGIGLGFVLRQRLDAARVVVLVRVVAGVAAGLLMISVLR